MIASADLGADLACALDPVVLGQHAGIQPDPWQVDVLRSTAPRIILNCSRQVGKSTTTAVLALHTALFEPGALVLLLAPSQRQAAELFRKVLDTFGALGQVEPPAAESSLHLELANGSRIIALPGKEATVRSYSGVRLLIVDEASRVPDELVYAVRPMLAVSGGQMVMLSSPFGTRGVFYETWRDGGPEWERYHIPATECPRISKEFLESERRALGSFWFSSEYMAEFVDAADAVFREADIQAAFNPDRAEASWLWAGVDTQEDHP